MSYMKVPSPSMSSIRRYSRGLVCQADWKLKANCWLMEVQ
jgi:hypothetical protein